MQPKQKETRGRPSLFGIGADQFKISTSREKAIRQAVEQERKRQIFGLKVSNFKNENNESVSGRELNSLHLPPTFPICTKGEKCGKGKNGTVFSIERKEENGEKKRFAIKNLTFGLSAFTGKVIPEQRSEDVRSVANEVSFAAALATTAETSRPSTFSAAVEGYFDGQENDKATKNSNGEGLSRHFFLVSPLEKPLVIKADDAAEKTEGILFSMTICGLGSLVTLEKENALHRDLKPENFLLKNNNNDNNKAQHASSPVALVNDFGSLRKVAGQPMSLASGVCHPRAVQMRLYELPTSNEPENYKHSELKSIANKPKIRKKHDVPMSPRGHFCGTDNIVPDWYCMNPHISVASDRAQLGMVLVELVVIPGMVAELQRKPPKNERDNEQKKSLFEQLPEEELQNAIKLAEDRLLLCVYPGRKVYVGNMSGGPLVTTGKKKTTLFTSTGSREDWVLGKHDDCKLTTEDCLYFHFRLSMKMREVLDPKCANKTKKAEERYWKENEEAEEKWLQAFHEEQIQFREQHRNEKVFPEHRSLIDHGVSDLVSFMKHFIETAVDKKLAKELVGIALRLRVLNETKRLSPENALQELCDCGAVSGEQKKMLVDVKTRAKSTDFKFNCMREEFRKKDTVDGRQPSLIAPEEAMEKVRSVTRVLNKARKVQDPNPEVIFHYDNSEAGGGASRSKTEPEKLLEHVKFLKRDEDGDELAVFLKVLENKLKEQEEAGERKSKKRRKDDCPSIRRFGDIPYVAFDHLCDVSEYLDSFIDNVMKKDRRFRLKQKYIHALSPTKYTHAADPTLDNHQTFYIRVDKEIGVVKRKTNGAPGGVEDDQWGFENKSFFTDANKNMKKKIPLLTA